MQHGAALRLQVGARLGTARSCEVEQQRVSVQLGVKSCGRSEAQCLGSAGRQSSVELWKRG